MTLIEEENRMMDYNDMDTDRYDHSFPGFDHEDWDEFSEAEFKSSFISYPSDERSFVDYMRSIPVEHKSLVASILVDVCSEGDATNAAALIEGQTGHAVDVNMMSLSGFTPLHGAAASLSPHITQLLLRHGARADLRNFSPHYARFFGGVDFHDPRQEIPLETALRHYTINRIEDSWKSEQTIVTLLTHLCLPETEYTLKTIRLLALNRKEVRPIFYHCAKRQRIVQLAILLLVAREEVMEGSMTIRHYITSVIEQHTDKLFKLMTQGEGQNLCRKLDHQRCCWEDQNLYQKLDYQRCCLRYFISTLMLLELFERCGDAFDTYLQSKRGDVAEEVAGLIKDISFPLKYNDVDLEFTNSIYQEPVQSILKKIESIKGIPAEPKYPPSMDTTVTFYNQSGSLYRSTHDPISGSVTDVRMPNSTLGMRMLHTSRTTNGNFGFEFPTRTQVQFMKPTKEISHWVTSFTSIKKWISFAFGLKRGIRCL